MIKKREFNNFHVLTPMILFLIMIVIVFSSDNPLIVLMELLLVSIIFICNGKSEKLKTGFLYFIPFASLIMIINMVFVGRGSTVLFIILNKRFTMEAMIYAIVMAIKLLTVMYLFMVLEILVDSDKAVSYFSNKMPKSTLTLMIGLKLVPEMKERFKNLMDIYTIRGVVFNKKKAREKSRSYVPILSILLEDSLESSFDIGEAAYVRGFLSTKRSIYDRQNFKKKDYTIIFFSFLLLAVYLVAQYMGFTQFNIYEGMRLWNLINYGILSIIIEMLIILIIILLHSEEN